MATTAKSFIRVAARSSSLTSNLRYNATNHFRFSIPRQSGRSARRGYASESTSSSSSGLYLAIFGAAAGVGGYYFYHTGGLAGLGKADMTSKSFMPTKEDYQKVYNAVAERLESDKYDDGSYGPVLVRLAWHCSGTYDKETQTGGSNGATMRFAPEGDHGANTGLKAARDLLEPVKEKFPWISYSDLWTLAGVTALQEMQGPIIPWRPGRADRDIEMCTPDGRLPDASKGQSHLRAIFGRMGFDDREIVALSGAHAIGRCHTDRSGFDGPWTFSPTVLTNDYYKLMLEEKWSYKKWTGPKQFEDVKTKSLMMLPTDMVLIKDKEFRKHVDRYARDNEVFFKEFSNVMVKLLELGVPFQSKEEDRMTFQPLP